MKGDRDGHPFLVLDDQGPLLGRPYVLNRQSGRAPPKEPIRADYFERLGSV